MKVALISLSAEGAAILQRLMPEFAEAKSFLHRSVPGVFKARRFGSIVSLTRELFGRYEGLIYAAPCGVVVRAISPNLKDKHTDPAVVVVDAGARYAISLLGGHEGGANNLAVRVSNILGAEPVITTATEARKSVIVGIGCRKGTEAAKIVAAVKEALFQAGAELRDVRFLASADIKSGEEGLLAAAERLRVPVRFLPSEEIRSSRKPFARSNFVEEKVKLPAVAEPAALLAGRRTRLILPRIARSGVTVAVARESFSWLESAREDR